MSSAAEQRQGVADLVDLAILALEEFWRLLVDLPAEKVRDALMDVLPTIGQQYGGAAASLAADWYDDLRGAADARGAFEPILPDLPDQARWESLARWGTGPLFQPEPERKAALTLISGGLQRSIADQHRLTVVESSIADPSASGWRRVGVGDSCSFCRMLIDRGHVYTEASVTFRSHDHCNCVASPEFASNVVKVSTEPFRQSQRNRSDATRKKDNARARAFIAANYGDN